MDIFDLVTTKDAARIMEAVDPVFKAAAQEASARAHALGSDVADERADEDLTCQLKALLTSGSKKGVDEE